MARRALRATACLLGCFLAACGGEDPTEEVGGCLTGGSATSSHLGLSPREINAIARLELESADADGHSVHGTCTGLLVGAQWILTARHCTSDPATTHVTAQFGAQRLPASTAACAARADGISGASVIAHPTEDLMLVRLVESPATRGIDVAPVTPDAGEDVQIGDLAQLAGYGRADDASSGALRFAAEAVTATTATFLEVDGRGQSGACAGDSGGPLLFRDASGAVRTVGVLSVGSEDCRGTDRYVRLRGVAAWLAMASPP